MEDKAKVCCAAMLLLMLHVTSVLRVVSKGLVMCVSSCDMYILHIQYAACQYATVCHARSSNFQLGACAPDLLASPFWRDADELDAVKEAFVMLAV
jgi:hypothetical protein